MSKKVLFLFAVILMIPGCKAWQKDSVRFWPLEEKKENYESTPASEKVNDFTILFIIVICLFVFVVVVSTTASAPEYQAMLSSSSIEPFFMPHEGQRCIKSLYKDLQGAKNNIFVASYWITHGDIISVLKVARKKDLLVEIIFDKSTPGASILQQEFLESGIKFTELEVDSALMHHKFIIVDDMITWVGSANLTKAAFRQNYENMIRIQSSEIARRYQIDFKNLAIKFGKSVDTK